MLPGFFAGAGLLVGFGEGPGATFGRTAKVGDEVQFFGPRGSLALAPLTVAPVFFGDETSFGVVHAFGRARELPSGVMEVSDLAEAESVTRALKLDPIELVAIEPNAAHLPRVAEALRAQLTAATGAKLMMTGRAQSIQALRALLKGSGAVPPGKTKAYWSVGKKGLD